jgi:HlyD family secretion protein
MFRQQALDRLASPSEIDRLMTVVSPRYWAALAALAGLCLAAVVWGVVGRVPETVEGAGVLVNPGRVRALQTVAAGQIVEVRVKRGDDVRPGQEIALLHAPELHEQRRLAQAKLEELRRFDVAQKGMEEKREREELSLLDRQRKSLGDAVEEIGKLADAALTSSKNLTQVQRDQLSDVRTKSGPLRDSLQKQLDSLRALSARGLVTVDQVNQVESSALQASVQASELEAKLAEVRLKDADAQQSFFQSQYRMTELRLQLQDLQVKALRLEQDNARARAERAFQIQDQEDRVRLLDKQIDEQEHLRSPVAGHVLEMAAQAGQVVPAGSRVGTIEADDGPPGESLRVLAYFPLRAGKRVRLGMDARVTPTTVQRERFGSIVGTVTRVAAFPTTEEAAAAAVGSPELVKALAQSGGVLEVEIEPERADTVSGFRWTSSGAPFRFTAGTSASVRVTVEERAPVTYAIPLLRGLLTGTEEAP